MKLNEEYQLKMKNTSLNTCHFSVIFARKAKWKHIARKLIFFQLLLA